jgi:hypothetical protein
MIWHTPPKELFHSAPSGRGRPKPVWLQENHEVMDGRKLENK